MEIRATSKFDLDACKALARLSMYKKADPRKRMIFWGITYGILLAVILLEIAAFGADTMMLVMIGLVVGVWLLLCYMYFIVPRMMYRAMAKLKDAENSYVFYEDHFKYATKGEAYSGESEIQYTMLVSVYETERYMFIFQTKQQALILDKQTIEGGTALQLREKLSAFVQKKYIICNY